MSTPRPTPAAGPPRPARRTTRLVVLPTAAALAVSTLATLALTGPVEALTSVTTANGAVIGINDARRPGLDTGSIRSISGARAEGLGNVFVHVDAPAGQAPRMNDQMLRGFGLTAASPGAYRSTRAVRLGDVLVTRKVKVTTASATTGFLDTFTNTATTPVRIEVSFGGSLGSGDLANKGTITATGSGDRVVDPADTWVVSTPSAGSARPVGVVVGTGVDELGDQQSDPFTTPYVATGSRANDLGFVRELVIEPGATESLAHYVVVGAVGDTQVAASSAALAASPDLSDLTLDEICTLQNVDLASYAAACVGAEPVQLPAADPEPPATTDVAYDVTGKTMADLQADMRAGRVTSVQVTQAYLDRIAAYDGGALGFHAFITVAQDAVAQARAADRARAAGRDGALLGVPIALKDLYDTADMTTTGGTLALETWRPGKDAWQVAKLREAGAVVIGKTNLSEFANSGSFSESGFQQTWNALHPSKTSFGSSGGSATAVGADLAPAAMGTQTGVSLYAPSTGAGLSTFRGTDGLTSTNGVMPLTWATDYAGPMAKSVTDLAALLDATATRTTGNDPDDLLTSRVDNTLRPAEWTSALRAGALQGRRIGYVPAAFSSTAITDDDAGRVALAQVRTAIEAAGGTLVPVVGASAPTAPPAAAYPVTGSAGAEGWERYIAERRPAAFPYTTKQLMESPRNLPYNVSANYTAQPMDDTSVANLLRRRDDYKTNAAAWMDTAFGAPVDAVVYPGFLTSVGNNDAASAIFSSDRASGVITQAVGLPTVVLPIGANAEGQSNSVQVVGRAWSDAAVLGMGYALEQQVATRPRTAFAPALPWSGPAASTTSLALAATGVTRGTSTTATVSVAADPAASGAVSLEVAGRTVTGTLAGGTAVLALPADLPVGTHLVTASYAGSPTVRASAATATLRVGRAAPVVTASLVRKGLAQRTGRARLQVAVRGPLTGEATVLVRDGSRVVRSATVPTTGRQVLRLPRLAPGRHRLSVLVVGSAETETAATAPLTLRVRRR